jgi:hypothetical protein
MRSSSDFSLTRDSTVSTAWSMTFAISTRSRASWIRPLCDARHVEEVVYEACELRRLARKHEQRRLCPLIIAEQALQELAGVTDRRERVPQLVREHRQKLVLLPIGSLQFLLGALHPIDVDHDDERTGDGAIAALQGRRANLGPDRPAGVVGIQHRKPGRRILAAQRARARKVLGRQASALVVPSLPAGGAIGIARRNHAIRKEPANLLVRDDRDARRIYDRKAHRQRLERQRQALLALARCSLERSLLVPVPRPVTFESLEGFCERLVDRLVEADEVLAIVIPRRGSAGRPLANDRSAERPVLRGEFLDAEAFRVAPLAVLLRRGVFLLPGSSTLRLVELLRCSLRRAQIRSNRAQHLLRVVS